MNDAATRPAPEWDDGRLHVLDLGQFIAGPFAATLLADLGADVIKVERPGVGDLIRGLPPGPADQKLGWQWAVDGRNKRSVTININTAEGQALVRRLLAWADVLVENTVPGSMAARGLDYQSLAEEFPRLVYVSVSGYGHGHEHSAQPGFDFVGAAFSGLTYATGFPDRPPVLPGYPVIDFSTGTFAALGALEAVRRRDGKHGTGRGEWVDLALYEPALRMTAAMVPDYARNGVVKQREGSTPNPNPDAPAANYWGYAYETSDGAYLSINPVGHSDESIRAVLTVIGRTELLDDPRLTDKLARIRNARVLDAALRTWVLSQDAAGAMKAFKDAGVPVSKIYNVADILADPVIRGRNLVEVDDPAGGKLTMVGVVPRLVNQPGEVRWSGEPLGASNDAVLGSLLGLPAEERSDLAARGII